jgi:hypothetical protein
MTKKKQEPAATFVRLEGPVENQDGDLDLWIPWQAGGDKLAVVAKGIYRREDHTIISCAEIN